MILEIIGIVMGVIIIIPYLIIGFILAIFAMDNPPKGCPVVLMFIFVALFGPMILFVWELFQILRRLFQKEKSQKDDYFYQLGKK